jgi:serine/threonine protein kinase
MARHCALGVSFLHGNGLMHRDIKSMNILVTEDYSCKLTDFGCAKLANAASVLNTVNSGTPLWMVSPLYFGVFQSFSEFFLVYFGVFPFFAPGYKVHEYFGHG